MPKRSRKTRDVNEAAFDAVQQIIKQQSEPPLVPREKNPAAQALGRLGGLKGGRVRAERMTPDERRESASRAAQARWERRTDDQ